MATQPATLIAERWLDVIVLRAQTANVGADLDDEITLPPGLGDVAILEIIYDFTSIATMVAAPEELGAYARILSASGNVVDFVSVGRFSKVSATEVTAWLSPDPLVLWRQNESLKIAVAELDTNASPTGDVTVYIKASRYIHQVTAPAPLQLVR